MAYSLTTGVYTPASGATTATAGQTIASATWNGIFNDITTALTLLGKADLMGINGAVNSVAQINATGVNFAASASDIATFSIPLPSSVGYSVRALYIGNAAATLGGVTVTLYTGAGATGNVVISSTATTVTATVVVAGAAATMQVLVPGSVNTVMFKASTLYLHISTSLATSSTADVALQITPIY